MILEESDTGALQNKNDGNRSNEIMSKLAATQNVMKSKFAKAYANRLEREYNLNQAMEPLMTSPINKSKSWKKDDSLRNQSKPKKTARQLNLAVQSYSNHAIKSRPMTTKLVDSEKEGEKIEHSISYSNIEKNAHNIRKYFYDPNELCNRLRLLLTSQIACDAKCVKEINTIIIKLYDLDILV